MAGESGTGGLGEARAGVERFCLVLSTPSPAVLEGAAVLIEAAIAEVAAWRKRRAAWLRYCGSGSVAETPCGVAGRSRARSTSRAHGTGPDGAAAHPAGGGAGAQAAREGRGLPCRLERLPGDPRGRVSAKRGSGGAPAATPCSGGGIAWETCSARSLRRLPP